MHPGGGVRRGGEERGGAGVKLLKSDIVNLIFARMAFRGALVVKNELASAFVIVVFISSRPAFSFRCVRAALLPLWRRRRFPPRSPQQPTHPPTCPAGISSANCCFSAPSAPSAFADGLKPLQPSFGRRKGRRDARCDFALFSRHMRKLQIIN